MQHFFSKTALNFKSHKESLEYLKKLGFNINPVVVLCGTIKKVIEEIEHYGKSNFE